MLAGDGQIPKFVKQQQLRASIFPQLLLQCSVDLHRGEYVDHVDHTRPADRDSFLASHITQGIYQVAFNSTTELHLWDSDMREASFPQSFEFVDALLGLGEQVAASNFILDDSDPGAVVFRRAHRSVVLQREGRG